MSVDVVGDDCGGDCLLLLWWGGDCVAGAGDVVSYCCR